MRIIVKKTIRNDNIAIITLKIIKTKTLLLIIANTELVGWESEQSVFLHRIILFVLGFFPA